VLTVQLVGIIQGHNYQTTSNIVSVAHSVITVEVPLPGKS